jgi:hypothetical protein
MFTGSTWSKPWQARIVLLTMLWLGQSTNGLVMATVSGLARLAGLSLEDTQKGLEDLLSPDPDSRTQTQNGRTIEKVEGGWQIINFLAYQELMNHDHAPNPNPNGKTSNKMTSSSFTKGNENENENDRNQVTSTPMKTLQNTSARSSVADFCSGSVAPEDWSPEEKGAFESLNTQRQRGMFLDVRGWAAVAAKNGEPNFPIAQDVLASKHYCSQRNVSNIIRDFQRLDYITMTARAEPLKKRASEYRWALPTTLLIPAYTGPAMEDQEDQEIEGIPSLEESEAPF